MSPFSILLGIAALGGLYLATRPASTTTAPAQITPAPGSGPPVVPPSPFSPLRPRTTPGYSDDPLGAILPIDVYQRVKQIIENFSASGVGPGGMTVEDLQYLQRVVDQYPASAPFINPTAEGFVNLRLSGLH